MAYEIVFQFKRNLSWLSLKFGLNFNKHSLSLSSLDFKSKTLHVDDKLKDDYQEQHSKQLLT